MAAEVWISLPLNLAILTLPIRIYFWFLHFRQIDQWDSVRQRRIGMGVGVRWIGLLDPNYRGGCLGRRMRVDIGLGSFKRQE